MQKKEALMLSLVIFTALFLLMANIGYVTAEEDDDALNGSTDDTTTNGSTDDTTEGNDSDDDTFSGKNSDDETEDDENPNLISTKDKNKIKDKIKEKIINANCKIKIEREFKIENGKRIEKIEKKIECADGTKSMFKLKIENSTVEGKVKEKIKYKLENESKIEVEAEDEIDLDENTTGTEYRLRAKLKNGNFTYIKIMPDTASKIAIERLKALNFTIHLKEKIKDNIPGVVYNIEANKSGKFLGIFKLKMKASAEVDPETGEVISVNTPWWAFLVSQSDETITEEDTGASGTFPEGTETNNTDEENSAS